MSAIFDALALALVRTFERQNESVVADGVTERLKKIKTKGRWDVGASEKYIKWKRNSIGGGDGVRQCC